MSSVPVTDTVVHGAFADGSDWAKVIPLLQREGLKVVAVQNPLSSLADDVAAARPEKVRVETLDSIVERLALPLVDVLKIDVEGAEASVIAGAHATLLAMQPILLMELNDLPLRAQGHSAMELLATLRETMGYEILNFSEKTGRLELCTEGARLSENIVAATRQRADELLRHR